MYWLEMAAASLSEQAVDAEDSLLALAMPPQPYLILPQDWTTLGAAL
jgi:hypothetical protein